MMANTVVQMQEVDPARVRHPNSAKSKTIFRNRCRAKR